MSASKLINYHFDFFNFPTVSSLLHIRKTLVHWPFLEISGPKKWVVGVTLALQQKFLAGTLNTQINIGEEGKSHKPFKICEEYCSSLTNWLDWLANVLRFMLRKGINFSAFMMQIKITAIADEND